MADYYRTREIEKKRLNQILNAKLEPLMPKEINKKNLTTVFSINGYNEPYESKITFYYDKPLNLPRSVEGVDIIQIYKLACRYCMSMAYPYCLCGNINN
ncbi:putative orfan [Tupanvirus soda lake]|uniref:Orfan n=2 Tax=Tupanvirus TaxID=2094720 RepID=A0AC62ACH1_9VIRU|nr:putative orfan [Tupanvirus soda lake]QKU35373.1 putative orfan [Tupanvirus soda lake]